MLWTPLPSYCLFPSCSKKLYKKITLIISQIHYSWNITQHTIFYETAPIMYFIYYRCYTTICCHFSYTVLLKFHMQLVLITFIYAMVLTIVFLLHTCHICYIWVRWYLLTHILSYRLSDNWDRNITYILWNVSTWYI